MRYAHTLQNDREAHGGCVCGLGIDCVCVSLISHRSEALIVCAFHSLVIVAASEERKRESSPGATPLRRSKPRQNYIWVIHSHVRTGNWRKRNETETREQHVPNVLSHVVTCI